MTKTLKMAEIELRDAVARQQPRRDIREIIEEAVLEAGDLTGAADLLGVDPSTLSVWVNRHLDGEVRGTVVFRSFTKVAEMAGAR